MVAVGERRWNQLTLWRGKKWQEKQKEICKLGFVATVGWERGLNDEKKIEIFGKQALK